MHHIVEKSRCCGCYACFNSCPKNAISMQEDNLGFKYPVIDQDKCVDCGACKSICPVLKSINPIAFACYNKNPEERKNSSSGGMFVLLAKEIIKRNGVVFGAAFDENFEVRHWYSESLEDLVQFMGSKYTQSVIGDAYKRAKEFLDDDRCVLFSGTPCQIEGLKSYLKKDYEKLYTQDLICHGVPSPKLWRKYLEYQKNKNKENIKSISFRNKDHGWSLFRMKFSFDTREYSNDLQHDLYLRAFLKDVCLRDSCYNCAFKNKNRNSDITLADYWGINNVFPEMNDDKGISALIIHSKKGYELFNCIKNDIVYKETTVDSVIKYNPALIKSAYHNCNEEKFAENIDKMEFDKLVDRFVPQPSLSEKFIIKIKNIMKRMLRRG